MAKQNKPRQPQGGGIPGGSSGGNPLAMLQQIQQQVLDAQNQLAEETITASAGGGAVKVVMTGDQHCRSIEIAPEVLQDRDGDLLVDLLLTAVNTALEESRQLAQRRLGPLTSGLGSLLPGI